MFLTHALRAIYRAAVVTGDSLWKYVSLLISGTPPAVTFISDASTSGNVLTLNGDTRPSNFNPYTPGYYSNYFDGTGDYLAGPTSNTSLLVGAGDFTVEAWIYKTADAFGTICSYGGSAGNLRFFAESTASNSAATTFWIGSTTLATGVTINRNTWYHVAVTRSGTTLRIFTNGVQSTSVTNSSDFNAGTLNIGGEGTGSSWPGYISNFRIVKGTALYTAAFTPPTAPLTAVANTAVLTCQSNRLIDNSLNNFVITKNGDTTVSGFIPFTPPTSVNVNTLYSTYFDGTGDSLVVTGTGSCVNFGTSNFTIEGWCYITSLASSFSFFDTCPAGNASPTNRIFIFIGSNGIIYYATSTGGTYLITSSAGAVSANQWTHIALVKSSSQTKLYVNGTQVGSTYADTLNYPAQLNRPILSANGYDGVSYGSTGYISNMRVVNGTAVYTANFTPPTAPLTAITNTALLTCQDATIKDNSTNAFAITSNGDARPIPVSPFTQTTTAVTTTYLGSGYFDGTGDYLAGPTSSAVLLIGAGDFTLEYWVYKPTSAALLTIASYGTGTGNFRHFIDGVTPSLWNGASAIGNGNTITIGAWNHIVLQRSGTTLRFYTNGISSATITNSSDFNAGTLSIGGETTSNPFLGYISNFHLVKGTALYTANFAPPAQPPTPVTNTKLLTLQTDQPAANKQFIDNSGSNLAITQAGNATQGTFSPYGANWSNYFDGTGDYLATPAGLTTAMGNGFAGNVITIEGWIYPTSFPSANSYNNGLIGAYAAVSANGRWWFGIKGSVGTTGNLVFTWTTSTSTENTLVSTSNSIVLNAWSHVAITINATTSSSTTINMFINGVLVNTFTGNDLSSQTAYYTSPSIGGNYSIYVNNYVGYISNFRVVKGTAVYTAAFTPSTTPLTAITNTVLLTCQSSRFVDNSTNAFTITVNGDTSVQRFSPFSPVIQTPTTYSTYFDGTGDYLTATGSAAFTLGTGDFTIECWFYTAVGTNNAMFQLSNTAGGFNTTYTNTIAIGLLAGKINLYGVAGTGITSTGSSYATSTWTHVALVRSSGVTKLYINGVLDTTVGTAGSITDTTSYTMQYIVVGGYYSTAYLWNGYVSNLRVVKGTAVYTAAFTPPTTPLTAITNTSLLTCQSATHIDNSSNAFTLTQNGDAVPRQFNPFGFTNTTTGTAYTPALYGGSAYFDGTGDYITAPTNAAAFSFATGDFTAEMQLYPTAFASYKSLWGCSSGAASSTGFHTGLNASGNVFIYSASAFKVTTTNAMNLNAWNHVAFVRSGTALNIYINGVLGGTWTLTTQTFTDSAGWFGAAPGLASEYYTGYLNDFKITKGTALYKGSFVPPLAPMTAVAGTTLLLNMDKGAAVDSSRSNDLETVGDAKITYETPYAGSYYSNYFDGTGDYLTYPVNAATQLGTNNFTIEFWLYVAALPSTRTELCYLNGNASGYAAISLHLTATNKLGLSFSESGSSWKTDDTTGVGSAITAGSWNHIALVRNGQNIQIYLNGASQGAAYTTTASGTSLMTTYTVNQIAVYNTAYYFVTGYISNFRLVNGTAVYTANFTPPTAPLTAISGTSLLTCQSKSFVDNSSNAFAITRNGDVAVKSMNPFQKNTYSSMYFDGTGDYLNIPTIPTAFVFGSSDFTIEFWSYFAATPAGTVWAGNFNNNTTALGVWTCYYYAVGEIAFFYGGSLYKITYTLVPGQWYHIAFVRSGTTIKIFVNGAQVGTTGTISASITTANLQGGGWNIGRSNDAAAYLNGYMADLRITNSARTTGTTFPVPTAPLPTS